MAAVFAATDGTQLPILELPRNYEYEVIGEFGPRLSRETVEYIGNTYEKLYTYDEENGEMLTESNWLLVEV